MYENIERIPSHYVNEEKGCAQIMLSYHNSLTLFNKDGIIFNQNNGQYKFINEYLNNMSRYHFPYHNIPNHIRRQGWFGRINCTNQILNFDEHYISISDGIAIDRYLTQDNKSALIMTKILPYEFESNSPYSNSYKIMTREELDNMFKPSTETEKVYLATTTGDIYHSPNMGYHDEETLLKSQKEKYIKQLEEAKHHFSNDSIEFIKNKIQSMELSDLQHIPLQPICYLIKIDGPNIKIKLIFTELIKSNHYVVKVKNIPLDKYVLEQFKYMAPNIIELKEPKISSRLNPGITKDDIKEAKEMALKLKRDQ